MSETNITLWPCRAPDVEVKSVRKINTEEMGLGSWNPTTKEALVPVGDTPIERAIRQHEAGHASFELQADIKTMDAIAQIIEDIYIHSKLGRQDGSAARDEQSLAVLQLHGFNPTISGHALLALRSLAILGKYPIMEGRDRISARYIEHRLGREKTELAWKIIALIGLGHGKKARKLILDFLRQEEPEKQQEEPKRGEGIPSPSPALKPDADSNERKEEEKNSPSPSPDGPESDEPSADIESSPSSGSCKDSDTTEAGKEASPSPSPSKKARVKIPKVSEIKFVPPSPLILKKTVSKKEEEGEDTRTKASGIVMKPKISKLGNVTMYIFDRGPFESRYSAARDNGVRKYQPAENGTRLRQNVLTDIVCGSETFACSKRVKGLSVVVDMSASMNLEAKDVRNLLQHFPASLVAFYNAEDDDDCGGQGRLVVCAKDGQVLRRPWMYTEEDKVTRCEGITGNLVDYLAIRWLLQQRAPRILVTDGGYTGPHTKLARALTEKEVKTGGLKVYMFFWQILKARGIKCTISRKDLLYIESFNVTQKRRKENGLPYKPLITVKGGYCGT